MRDFDCEGDDPANTLTRAPGAEVRWRSWRARFVAVVAWSWDLVAEAGADKA